MTCINHSLSDAPQIGRERSGRDVGKHKVQHSQVREGYPRKRLHDWFRGGSASDSRRQQHAASGTATTYLL